MESSIKNPKICIVGAGFSGMCAAIKLQTDLNIYDYTILDENHDVGGTWLTHTYPGCACDVASHLYSYSFELNPNWTQSYASQPEILAYLKGVALKYDLYSKIQFHHQVKEASWDDSISKWRIIVHDKLSGNKSSEHLFDIVIGGIGGLRLPLIPEQFLSYRGTTLHTSKWDSNVVLDDKTVCVIGSGCSAVQIIPNIQSKVKRLISFQRHPAWVVPLPLYHISSIIQWIFRKIPLLMFFYRVLLFIRHEMTFAIFKGHSKLRELAKWYSNTFLGWQIPDNPELRSKLIPNYEFGCKRVSPSNAYYKALANPNCEVIRDKIKSVTAKSIVTENGNEYFIDVLILATGYRVQDFFSPLKIYGKHSEDVLEVWKRDGPSHYLGIMSNNAPNFFALLGPNTAYGHNSVVFSIECQVNWIMQVIKEYLKRESEIVGVTKRAEKAYMADLKEKFKDTVWSAFECGSWYLNDNGINTTLYPGSLIDYWNKTKKPVWTDLEFSC